MKKIVTLNGSWQHSSVSKIMMVVIELVDVIDRAMVNCKENCSGCSMSFSTMKLGVEKYHQTICTKHQRSGGV